MCTDWTCNNSFWTREENKAFEDAFAIYSGDSNPWDKIAAAVPGRTFEEIKHHFELLVVDVNAIDSDHVPLPLYADSFDESGMHEGPGAVCRKRDQSGKKGIEVKDEERFSQSKRARNRGIPWTIDEHRLFLQGLKKYGRGDWRSISRHAVLSRTPTQIASHAQKFFKRLSVLDKHKKRPSIHDATVLDDGYLLTQRMQDTEQISGASGGSILDTSKYPTLSLGVALCTSPISSDCDRSASQGPSSEQITADIDFDSFPDPVTSLPGISMHQSSSTEEMTGAANVGATPTASQHGKFNYQGPRAEPMTDAAGVDLIANPSSSQHGISNSRGASIEQMTGDPDVGLCAPLVTGQQKISTPLGPSTKQVIGESHFGLFADPMASPPDLSTPQGPSTEEMIGAADVGLISTLTASQHEKPTYEGPLSGPMQDASGVGFIADSMASHDETSTPHGAITEQMTGCLDVGLCATLITIEQNISTPQGPSIEQMTKDSDFGLFPGPIANLPGISTPQLPSSPRTIGAADVGGFIAAPNASQHGTLNYQGSFAEPTTDAAGVGFIADSISSQDGISTTQGPTTEVRTAATDDFAKKITAATAFDLDNPLDTTQHDMTSLQRPITGKMIGSAGGGYIVKVGKSPLPCGSDCKLCDPPSAMGEPILLPVTSEVTRKEIFPSPSSMWDDLGSPFYGPFDSHTPMDMDNLTFPIFPSDDN